MRGISIVAASVLLAACTTAPRPVSPGATPIAATVPGRATIEPTSTASEASAGSPEPSLAALIDAAGMLEHLEAFQASVDESASGETSRAIDTIAYSESVSYVHRELRLAGYYVERHAFEWAGVRGENIIVELPGADDDVIMLGAHMDSVAAGPGINDNGSGVAALLEIAEHLRAGPRPSLTVRFAFWGAEEGGPFGSAAYVDSMVPEELARITAYLNFDMLASPNAVRFVYDEAGSAPGSEVLTAAFGRAFDKVGLAWEAIDLEGDTDHGPFTDAGIPTGGLFSGGIEPVTDAQAAEFGAVAGEPADPCSHRACDNIDNVDLETLEQMADAIATVLVTLAGAH